MTRKAKWICIEGTDGVGKTTQTNRLAKYLADKGYKVLQTKEPGTPLSPLTMELRNLMLNAAFDDEMTLTGRELISQAIRSIHIERVIKPALEHYDFIIQDRGLLSGLAYGEACGNDLEWLEGLMHKVSHPLIHSDGTESYNVYDKVIYLTSDKISERLKTAKESKQEFEAGDAIEAKGASFMLSVRNNMNLFSNHFETVTINVDNRSIQQVFEEILKNI